MIILNRLDFNDIQDVYNFRHNLIDYTIMSYRIKWTIVGSVTPLSIGNLLNMI